MILEVEGSVTVGDTPYVKETRQISVYVAKEGRWELKNVAWDEHWATTIIESARQEGLPYCVVRFTLPRIRALADPCN